MSGVLTLLATQFNQGTLLLVMLDVGPAQVTRGNIAQVQMQAGCFMGRAGCMALLALQFGLASLLWQGWFETNPAQENLMIEVIKCLGWRAGLG